MTRYIVILTITVVILPLITSSQTIEELQAQIAALMRQVQELQVQLQGIQGDTTTTEWCHTFNTNISIGSRGDEVKAIHHVLNKEGYSVVIDTSLQPAFNSSHKSAIILFQEKYKSEILTPLGLKYGTGFVGPSTRKKLNELYGCGGNIAMSLIPNQPTSQSLMSTTSRIDDGSLPIPQLVFNGFGDETTSFGSKTQYISSR